MVFLLFYLAGIKVGTKSVTTDNVISVKVLSSDSKTLVVEEQWPSIMVSGSKSRLP